MPEPLWCNSCIFWSFAYDDGTKKFGKCNNPSVLDYIRVVQEENVEDIFTEQYFGCVWHRKNAGVVAEVKIKMDEETMRPLHRFWDKPTNITCELCGAENSSKNETCINCNSKL